MNWTRFQTYGTSPDKAFEMLCNQLFENWCKSEYDTQLASFNVVNGAGGDGGVESYATLTNGDIVGLQAKWFLNSIDSSQISQIKGSLETAVKVRPEIVRYIVCVPRDLASITGRGVNTEDARWRNLVSALNAAHPNLAVELWNDTRITTELQKSESVGIHRFWFENAELTDECFGFAIDKATQSWLSTKYVPELNVPGEINNALNRFLGSVEHRKSLAATLAKVAQLSEDFEKAAFELLSVCGEKPDKLKEIVNEASTNIVELKASCNCVEEWMRNDSSCMPSIQESAFYIDYESIIERIRDCHLSFSYHSHIHEATKVLDKLAKIDFHELLSEIRDCLSKKNIMFLGNPGTGKTQGVGAFASKMLSDGTHLPVLVQARSVLSNQTWRDIIIQNLGLSNAWGEDDLWQALVSTVNRHKFIDDVVSAPIKLSPKALVIVDGMDESSDREEWVKRIQETTAISAKYPQIRFCFTSRPAAIPAQLNDIRTIRLSAGGDVPAFKLFDDYIKAYNISAINRGWLRFAIATPLALKLFCELNANSTVEISNRYEVSMEQLWKKKIDRIELELENKEGLPARNQYTFRSIVLLASLFVEHESIEQTELIVALQTNLSVDNATIQKLITHFELCGILRGYRERGHGLTPDKFYFYPGIQGYFDYASALTLIDKYKHPKSIIFSECSSVSVNTLYALSVISIQEYNYLITWNDTIKNVHNSYSLDELQFIALQNSNYDTARQFVARTKEIMNESADALVSIVNNLVLPLSRDVAHPLGVSVLNDFLSGFEFPAQRDILWSVPAFLHESHGKRWGKSEPLALDNEEYVLTLDDTHDGLPTIYAWALSTVDNSLRKSYRDSLMIWARMNSQEYFELFSDFAHVNDPQIKSDLFSILMCLMYDGADRELIKSVSVWICKNILSPDKIDENRDISIRYYSIAIVERAKMLDIITAEEARPYLPPYTSEEYCISLNKEALSGTRMGGYSAIDYDLSRYVLVDHLESDFNPYSRREDNQFDELIKKIAVENSDYSGITPEQFIISAAYAFILDMGWNESEFYNYDKDENDKFIGGVDCSINGSYQSATHGAQSQVMTVCEKYVWQARNYISGFLSDRLLYGNERIQLTDYGMLDDFNIPVQEISQIDPDNIPEDRPWHIPEISAVILDEEKDSPDAVISAVLNAPSVDWKRWIAFKNEQHKYAVAADDLLALSAYSCFIGAAGVETDLFINSVIIDSDKVIEFIDQLKTNTELSERIFVPSDWDGGIESSCYITPKEICWFPWKKRYNSYNTEEFPQFDIQSAVDGCVYNFPEYGDVYYSLPSAPIRQLLGTIDSDGYIHWDKDEIVRSEYSIAGEKWHTQQDYLIVDKDLLFEKLFEQKKSLVWFMEDLRRETSVAREKYGEFYAEKRVSYIGLFENGHFIVEELKRETSSRRG